MNGIVGYCEEARSRLFVALGGCFGASVVVDVFLERLSHKLVKGFLKKKEKEKEDSAALQLACGYDAAGTTQALPQLLGQRFALPTYQQALLLFKA